MAVAVRDRYELEAQLASGDGTSQVWSARDRDGYEFLIKLWRFEGDEPDPVRRALWDEELRTLYRLSSSPGAEQSVVRLRDALVDRESKAFVMVLEAGGYESLSTLLTTPATTPWIGQRSVSQRAGLWRGLRRLAAGLQLLHQQHVIHRCVDAANVLVDEDLGVETMRLSGFEWSIRLGTPVSRSAPAGLWCTPPELLQDGSGYRPETDWYGLGMLAARTVLNIEDLAGEAQERRCREVLRRVAESSSTQLSGLEKDLIQRLVAVEPHDRLVHAEDILPAIEDIESVLASPSRPLSNAAFHLVVDPKKPWLLEIAQDAGFELRDEKGIAFNPINDLHVAQLTSFIRDRLAQAELHPLGDGERYVLIGAMRPLKLGPFKAGEDRTWEKAFVIGPCEFHRMPGTVRGVSVPEGAIYVRTVKQAFGDATRADSPDSWERLMSEAFDPEVGRSLQDFLDFLRLTNQIDLVIRDAEVFPFELVEFGGDSFTQRLTIRERGRRGEPPPKWCQVEGGLAHFLAAELSTNKPDCDIVVLTREATLSLSREARQVRWEIVHIGDDGLIELRRSSRDGQFGRQPAEEGFIRTWGLAAGQIPLIRRRANAIDRLGDHGYLLEALTAPGRVYMDTGEAELGVALPEEKVDGPKRAAIEDITRVRPIYALQGPPGTGKTTMVAWLLREILADDPVAQVLITAQAHGAVDVLRRKVATEVFADLPAEQQPLAVRLRANDGTGEEGSAEAVALAMLQQTAATLSASDLAATQQSWQVEVARMIRALSDDDAANSDAADFVQLVRRAANLTYCTTSAGDLETIARDQQSFDWSIIEEAGKAHGFDLALPMQAGHRWLLIGDHEQLPPYRYTDYLSAIADLDATIDRLSDMRERAAGMVDIDLVIAWDEKTAEQRKAIAEYSRSHLATFHQVFLQAGRAPGTAEANLTTDTPVGAAAGMLSGQHRMHPDIGDLISNVFYDGRVENRTVAADGSPLDRVLHHFNAPASIADKAVVWLDLPSAMDDPYFEERGPAQRVPRYTNPAEARALVGFLSALSRQESHAPLSFAALSPYNRQVQLLREELRAAGLPAGLEPIADLRGRAAQGQSPAVSHTVDAFQGNQAEVVAVSLVRNNQRPKERGIGFLRDSSRLNVLLSRAERLLVLVGSWDFFMDQASLVNLDDRQHELWHLATALNLLEGWFAEGRAVRIDAVGEGWV